MEYLDRTMRAPLALLVAAFALAGCAKFPKSGTSTSATRLHFEFTLSDSINPNYVYLIAIQPVYATGNSQTGVAATTGNELKNGPIPVVSLGGNNGFVTGYPTRFIQYTPSLSIDRYTMYRFATVAEAPLNPTQLAADPNAPVNPLVYNQYRSIITNSGIDPSTITGSSDGRTLGFDIDASDLTDDTDHAAALTDIQFNILTMNKVVSNVGSLNDRVMDALGDQGSLSSITFNDFRRISVQTSDTFSSSTSADPETSGDTFNGTLPSVDITSWTVRVSLP